MTIAEIAAGMVAEFDARADTPDPYRQAWRWLDEASNAVANIDGAGMVVRHQLPVARLTEAALVRITAAESLLMRLKLAREEFSRSLGDGP